MDDEALELVLGKLDGVRQQSGYWMAQCPAHEDRKASLSIARGTEQPVIFKCHAGCDRDAILDAIGLTVADISKPREERDHGEWTPFGEAIAIYDYTDEHGKLLYQVCRTAKKEFPQRRPDATKKSGWRWSLGDMQRVPYRLPKLIAAISEGRTVYITEGEKDVHSVERAGAVATTSPGGAGKWRGEYDRWFKDAAVVIIADRDEPGRKHAADVAEHLSGIARSVKVAEAASGKDATDHLAAGHPLEDLVPHISVAGTDKAQTELAEIAARYTPVDWAQAWSGQPAETDWLLAPILETGTVNVLYAKPGTGKSLLALDMALQLVRDDFTVVYVDDENRITDIVERLQAFGAKPGELGRLMLYSFAGLPPLDTLTGGAHLLALASTAGAALVVLDTTTRMVQGKENDADTFLQLYRCSLVPLKARGITVLRLDHPGKDVERGQRGSSAKDGDADTIWRLTEEVSGQRYKLHRDKSRSGHGGDEDVIVHRRYSPVRHAWTVRDSGPSDRLYGQVCGQLDTLGVPRSSGRDRCRTALANAGFHISNEQLAAIVRKRRYGLDSSRTDGQSSASAADCPPPPNSKSWGDGQASTHPPELWPEGSYGEAAG